MEHTAAGERALRLRTLVKSFKTGARAWSKKEIELFVKQYMAICTEHSHSMSNQNIQEIAEKMREYDFSSKTSQDLKEIQEAHQNLKS